MISLAALERALSPERLKAYTDPTDADATDGLARYLWNLALADALHPALHALEVCFRNQLNRAAVKLTAPRAFTTVTIPSWLDANPTMLMAHEYRKLQKAKDKLVHPRTHTEGHLVAKLDFGFCSPLPRQLLRHPC